MNTTPAMIARWTAQIGEWRNAGPAYVIAVKPPDMLALLDDLATLAADNEALRTRLAVATDRLNELEGAREWLHVRAPTAGYEGAGCLCSGQTHAWTNSGCQPVSGTLCQCGQVKYGEEG